MVFEIRSLDRDSARRVLSIGKKVYIKDKLKFVYLKDKTNVARVSFAVGKKIEKLAVNRNKIKRKLKGVLESNKNDLKSFSGLFYIYNKSKIEEIMVELLKQERILN